MELWIRLLGMVGFGVAGWRLTAILNRFLGSEGFLPWGLLLTLGGVVVGLLVTPYLTTRPLRRVLRLLDRIPLTTLLAGTLGLVVGLVVAALISIPVFQLEGWLGWGIPLMLSFILGLLGLVIGSQRERELRGLVPEEARTRLGASGNGKILVDTSAIIDGRIADLTLTGFLQGILVIPRFVLDELRHIADSSDTLRRNRGRRGLEVLSRLRKDSSIPIQILDADTREGGGVDSKLVRLAKSLNAPILTTDFNLNRVAELQGIRVLNINVLANALKPVLLPGEELTVQIIQEGKEPGQGVGFLDDGTMVVVDGGRRYINTHLDVTVTRVLQTAAGRIIFAQPKGG
jgi:uncharacterized protein YacL